MSQESSSSEPLRMATTHNCNPGITCSCGIQPKIPLQFSEAEKLAFALRLLEKVTSTMPEPTPFILPPMSEIIQTKASQDEHPLLPSLEEIQTVTSDLEHPLLPSHVQVQFESSGKK